MLNEHKNDQLSWIQLMADERPLEGYPSRAEAEKSASARGLFTKLDKVETTLKTNEVAFRKQVADHEQEIRKARARQLGPQKRAGIQARVDQRAADQDAFTRELYRRAGLR
jgi:hypothetical protein